MITSLSHPLVKQICRLRKSRSERYRTQQVVVEGNNLLQELLLTHSPTELLLRENERLPDCLQHLTYRIVSARVMAKISDCKEPPGLIALLPMGKWGVPKNCQRLLILGGVADPGNLGTLLRSAAAFGWEGVFLLEGCCDPYNPKALRAAKGATFRIGMQQGEVDQLPPIEHLFVADLEGSSYREMESRGRIALLLGNEAHGVGQEWREGERITIPIASGVESLNVAIAGSILMEYFRGQG